MRDGEVPLAEQSAKRGARLVALRRLREAERAFTKAVDADAVGLHRFRVALRRTRTVLRQYEPWLEESISRKSERRLRRLARTSNTARDYEVFAGIARKLGVHELAEQLFARDQRRSLEKFRKAVVNQFPALARALKRGLSHYSMPVKPGRGDEVRFGTASADVVRQLRTVLANQLSGITTLEQQEEAHKARITVKRLRYLLEPFRREVEACKAAVLALRALQDDLGELHDLQMLGLELQRRLPEDSGSDPSQIAHMLAGVEAAATKSFNHVFKKYLQPGGSGVAGLLDAAAAELKKHARRDVEIERKYLLRGMPRLRGAKRLDIIQGYLPGNDIHERVRAVTSEEGKRYYRTIKAGTGMLRSETEEQIDHDLFKQLWRLTRGRRIRKRRYVIEAENGTWSVDKFKDRTLHVAEIELTDENSEIALPRWLRNIIVADVTDDPQYTNHALAK